MGTSFHPDLQFIAKFLPRGVGHPLLIKLLRRFPAPSRPLPAGVSVRELRISENASVRVISNSTTEVRPAVLWIHGGGYVIGSAKQDDWFGARIAKELNVVVISVEYRLAPENPYPAPLNDCFAAYEYIHREASSLNIDPTRVVIAGQSAGGGLAAALALRIHDRQRPAPVLQLLVYPMLDDRTATQDIDDKYHRLWNQTSNRLGWSSYLAKAPGASDVHEHAAPARRTNLEGLPPTWIGVGTLDLFYKEDVDYAERLKAAGVATTLEVVDGAFHGFDAVLPNKPVSQSFFRSQLAAIKGAIER